MSSLSGLSTPLTARRLPSGNGKALALPAGRFVRPAASRRALLAVGVSLLVHAALLILGLRLGVPARASQPDVPLEVNAVRQQAAPATVQFSPEISLASEVPSWLDEAPAQLTAPAPLKIAPPPIVPRQQLRIPPVKRAWTRTDRNGPDPLTPIGGGEATELAAARSESSRRQAVRTGAATAASESAVDRAIQWLADHQMADGGWSFDHRQKACKGHCGNPGTLVQARVAATSLALLPLLGAGYTHKQGKYRKAVQGGLSFLGHSIRLSADGGDLQAGGMMYSHGLATIALCEAFAMTKDRQLAAPAQAALNFIASGQDPQGGGWRYSPGMAGDTSVFGWQLMALKSGHMGSLAVPPRTIQGAIHFLDTVQRDDGAQYGYIVGQDRGQADRATTAIGLLARMYLGWRRDHPALVRGIELLDRWGPSDADLYFDYYAAQVLRHHGGDVWQRWNAKMRDRLVETQARSGHETGSWYVAHTTNDVGGRLYCTALSAMILEVYYRHMPLYQKDTTGEGF